MSENELKILFRKYFVNWILAQRNHTTRIALTFVGWNFFLDERILDNRLKSLILLPHSRDPNKLNILCDVLRFVWLHISGPTFSPGPFDQFFIALGFETVEISKIRKRANTSNDDRKIAYGSQKACELISCFSFVDEHLTANKY